MTENHIKEALSKNFVKTLAHYRGINSGGVDLDYGEDLVLSEIITRTQNGSPRLVPSGRTLCLQLKSTTESKVTETDEAIRYSLEAKTYNDLIFRRDASIRPLILILFVLPNDRAQWISLNVKELVIRKNAYWFIPSSDETSTKNTDHITITIPKGNLLTLDSFHSLFDFVEKI